MAGALLQIGDFSVIPDGLLYGQYAAAAGNTWQASGQATVSFVGASNAAGVATLAGQATVSFVGASMAASVLTAGGQGALNPLSGSNVALAMAQQLRARRAVLPL